MSSGKRVAPTTLNLYEIELKERAFSGLLPMWRFLCDSYRQVPSKTIGRIGELTPSDPL
jgi:hypothetical protein